VHGVRKNVQERLSTYAMRMHEMKNGGIKSRKKE
jgi:hypothetical protein